MRRLASDNPEEQYKNDYHGHPNYIVVGVVLVIALIISIIPAFTGITKVIVIIVAFGIALFKAIMVIANFMHIRYEPRLLIGLVGFALFVLLAFFFGVWPDTLKRGSSAQHQSIIIMEHHDPTHKDNIKEFKKLGYKKYAEKILKNYKSKNK